MDPKWRKTHAAVYNRQNSSCSIEIHCWIKRLHSFDHRNRVKMTILRPFTLKCCFCKRRLSCNLLCQVHLSSLCRMIWVIGRSAFQTVSIIESVCLTPLSPKHLIIQYSRVCTTTYGNLILLLRRIIWGVSLFKQSRWLQEPVLSYIQVQFSHI